MVSHCSNNVVKNLRLLKERSSLCPQLLEYNLCHISQECPCLGQEPTTEDLRMEQATPNILEWELAMPERGTMF